MTGMAFDPFALEDDGERSRYFKPRKGETEHIQCRADAFNVRRIDEIVASRIEPSFKTRSDVIQDALAMWLEDWDRRYPDSMDSVTAGLKFQMQMRQLEMQREFRNDFYDQAERQLEHLKADRDVQGIRQYLSMINDALVEFRPSAPQSYIDKVEKLQTKAQELLDAH